VFENLDGKMVVTHGKAVKTKVLTNDTYVTSAAALAAHRGFGGEKAIPTDAGSLTIRFARLATACAAGGARMLDILTAARGDVTSAFVACDPAANLKLVESSLAPIARHFPPKAPALLANHPSQAKCAAR
jgi:hypothetical protein